MTRNQQCLKCYPVLNRRRTLTLVQRFRWLVCLGGWVLFVATSARADEPVDFDSQIMPLFSKLGCNAADCHGASSGRGGFQLSLFGSDPAADFDRIVNERLGRRVLQRNPARSFLLLKGTETIAHEGGQRLDPAGPEFELIRTWIEQGAIRLQTNRLLAVRLAAERRELRIGQSVGIRAIAEFQTIGETSSPPTTRQQDVTSLAVFQCDDGIELTSDQQVLARHAGQHNLIVRFLNQVAVLQLIVPVEQPDIQFVETRPSDVYEDSGALGIDQAVAEQLKRLGLPAMPLANDATLFRRVYLDLVGELPAIELVSDYCNSADPEKYPKLINQLLADDRFSRLWTYHCAEWLRAGGNGQDDPMAAAYVDWIGEEVRGAASIAHLATQSLTAVGAPRENGAVGFLRLTNDPRLTAEMATNTWMGVRISCANCHNHPLDRWTRDDYFSFAAFFGGLRRGDRVEWVDSSALVNPLTRKTARPKLPGRVFAETGDQRSQLAEWLTAADNPFFHRVVANRIWAILMGVGEVEPVDDFRISNPPANEALLQHLSQILQDHQTQLRPLVRSVVLSRTYRRTVGEGALGPPDRFHGRRLEKPLPPPVLLGAIEQVTSNDGQSRINEYLTAPRGGQLPELLELGQCNRTESCNPTSALHDRAGGLSENLRLLNGAVINQRLRSPPGLLASLLSEKKSDQQILERVYQTAYSRTPNQLEREHWLRLAEQATVGENKRTFWQDFVWAIVNSREFATNH